jgi:N-acetylmuramoyl-L-alanine amidase
MGEAQQPNEINWRQVLVGNLRLLLFLALAGAGMLSVFWYFQPDGLSPADVALASGYPVAADTLPGSAFAANGIRQRYAQSTGPTTIAIISGHKGNDAGAVCDDGLTEAQVNETIAQLVVEGLRARGVEATLLDEFDTRLPGYRGTALVSIHADSCGYFNELATGYKVAAAPGAGSQVLMNCMEGSYARATQLPYNANTITPHMTDYHAFRAIDSATPAIIIETGFMNLDRDLLTAAPAVPAQGIVDGLLCFLDKTP